MSCCLDYVWIIGECAEEDQDPATFKTSKGIYCISIVKFKDFVTHKGLFDLLFKRCRQYLKDAIGRMPYFY